MSKKTAQLFDTSDPVDKVLAPSPEAAQTAQTGASGPVAVPDYGNTRPIGVGLKDGEIDTLERIAKELEISRHAVARFAIQYFLKDYLNGGDTVQALASSIVPPEVRQPKYTVKRP